MIRATPYLLLIIVVILSSCTGTKNINSSDPMYVGYEIVIRDKQDGRKQAQSAAESVIGPEPNRHFLWMRPAVARYNMLSDSARTRKFWKNKVTAPVLLSQVKPTQVTRAMQDRVFHQGFYDNTVSYDTLFVSKRKAKFVYAVTLERAYTINRVTYPAIQGDLTEKIAAGREASLIKTGDRYQLDQIKGERIRIDDLLKEEGYIYFSPEFILVKADSVTGDHQVNLDVRLKQGIPPESQKAYTIRYVYIHDNYSLSTPTGDTLSSGHIHLIAPYRTLKVSTMEDGLFLRPGERYSKTDHLHTVRYYSDLPIIRNVNAKFLPDSDTDSMDVLLYLTQRKRFAYTAEMNTVFRSTNYFGPGVIFSYEDRNANRGAEVLKLNLKASFEMQIVDGKINPAYELGVGMDYTLPQFFPGFLLKTRQRSLPKTTITAAYHLFNRLDLYRLNSSTLNLRYTWNKTDKMIHSFYPIEVTYTRLPEDSKSDEFKDYLAENPGVQRSFDEQFITSFGYEFIYQSPASMRNAFFFRGGVDVAGHVLEFFYSRSDAPKDTLGRYSLFGVPFSQYIRPKIDLRYSLPVSVRSNLVSRLSVGIGIPVGNSSILPYVKQFYVGGTNSLRSFVARSLGPGSEVPPEGYNDLTGDIRLEGNLEYRFQIAGNLKGALFMDAGNIWLYNEDPTRPNGDFHISTFLDQLAMSAGWGLRWDFSFIVARLDFAYTMRTPYLPEGERWAAKYNFWDPAVNIAIGYPF